jgi:hypothetical protein
VAIDLTFAHPASECITPGSAAGIGERRHLRGSTGWHGEEIAVNVGQIARYRAIPTLTALSAVNVEFAEKRPLRSTLSSVPPPSMPPFSDAGPGTALASAACST